MEQVRILLKPDEDDIYIDLWCPGMDKFVGQVGSIIDRDTDDQDHGDIVNVEFSEADEAWWFKPCWVMAIRDATDTGDALDRLG